MRPAKRRAAALPRKVGKSAAPRELAREQRALGRRGILGEQLVADLGTNNGDVPGDGQERGIRHVSGQKRRGTQTAVKLEVGHRCGEVRAHGETDRGVQGARDNSRQTRAANDAQGVLDATEWLNLDDQNVGCTDAGDFERIRLAAHALICRNGDSHVSNPFT
jgi:hypothetical protein